MPVRICVAIRESTTSGAIEAAARAKEWADLVEIRADYIHDLDVRRLLLEKRGPVAQPAAKPRLPAPEPAPQPAAPTRKEFSL